MVESKQLTIEETLDSRQPAASEAETLAPQSVVEHHLVDDDEWGEIEEIVVYSDAA